MSNIPFQVIDWNTIDKTEKQGLEGFTTAQTMLFQGLKVRIVNYSPGYLADHWCTKGHIVHCLQGEFVTEHEDGSSYTLTQGMTYIVSDDLSSHRSKTANGVKLLIIDGDFLK
jgi:mannose-6-phosphate isomerase class I